MCGRTGFAVDGLHVDLYGLRGPVSATFTPTRTDEMRAAARGV
jgi:hypothetical protein